MSIKLVVINSFADYQRGDQITDPATVAEIRESHNAGNVVVVTASDEAVVVDSTAASA